MMFPQSDAFLRSLDCGVSPEPYRGSHEDAKEGLARTYRLRFRNHLFIGIHVDRFPGAVFGAQGASNTAVIVHDADLIHFHMLRTLHEVDAVHRATHDTRLTAGASFDMNHG